MSTVLRGKVTLAAENPSSSSSSTSIDPNDVLHGDIKESDIRVSPVDSHTAPLCIPRSEKRFWFQKDKTYDPSAIATQPSVYDDLDLAKDYRPREDWENLHRFDPSARWTWGEENKLIRKIDLKIMVFAAVAFMYVYPRILGDPVFGASALELDRANISQANTDNFLGDLGLTTNDFNLGNTVFKLAFLCAELPSQLVSKWVGPDRWIPSQMILWSIVAASQYKLDGRSSFLACRALLGILQGGFIPDIILYLSYFYKHHELSIRLGFFWTAMSIADILSAFLGYGILHMRGVQGQSGWRWLFLIEGLFTFLIGVSAFVFMPPSPTKTANWARGKKGWFTEREETIMINRVIREDPSKGTMHNRQPITPKLLWQSLQDLDLWPLYILGLLFQVPTTPQTQYLTLSLKGLGFSTFSTNLLSIPYTVIHMILMLSLTYFAEVFGELTFTSMTGQIWSLPFLIYFAITDRTKVNKWVTYATTTLLLSYPTSHPIQVAWNSRNANSVRSRTVSAACYNMFVQAGGIIGSNIYRADDAPKYKRGNRVLLAIACLNILLYCLTKAYYVFRNKQRDKKWNALTEHEKLEYVATTKDEGNKRLDFRFAN